MQLYHYHPVQNIFLFTLAAEVWNRFKVCTVFETIPEERCFPTLQDALAQSKQTSGKNNVNVEDENEK